MRAWQVSAHGGPEALEFKELPTPAPGPGQVRVAVRACALNRLDLWVRNGVPGHRFPLPLVLGSEVAGVVEALGAGVEGLEAGTPALVAPGVSCGHCERCVSGEDQLCREYGILGEHRDGGYAEQVVVPRRNVLPLPRGLSFVEAAAVPLVFLTAWHMLERAGLRRGEDVLVHAAGSGVSSAAIQIARLLGARAIVATAGSEAKLERARELGATHTVDYRTADFVPVAREATGGKGVEVVVDHVGGEVFERSFKALAWAGRVVLCGATAGGEARINLRAVFFKSLSILGSTMGTLGELHRLLPHFESGALVPVVDRTLPFEQAREAQAALENREQFGKIVLTVGDPGEAHRVPRPRRPREANKEAAP
ncbi:MAG TPA: zinc-binding dehydrogenase [Thermoanaerobaculia bacterium]|nr:zinc-binding dehydrogenase [Thermoanaerobaculia bacterium]